MAYGKTKKWMIGGAALAGTAVLTAALWQGLTLRRYALHTDKLSAPVRLLLLTDLHSTFYGRAQRGLLSAIQAQTPDAVLLAGDMADDSRGDAGVDALMSALGGACPCCYVSGNHEVRTGCLEALKRRFRSWGITVLEGSGTLLATPGGTLRICGVDDPSAFAGESGWLEQFRACQALTGDSRYTVLLSHRPERTECYRDSGFDLVVSAMPMAAGPPAGDDQRPVRPGTRGPSRTTPAALRPGEHHPGGEPGALPEPAAPGVQSP